MKVVRKQYSNTRKQATQNDEPEREGQEADLRQEEILQLEEENKALLQEMEQMEQMCLQRCKQMAMEMAVKEASGKNVKAILALADTETAQYDYENGLQGLDLEKVKAEAPYLFQEEKKVLSGTGLQKNKRTDAQQDATIAFRKALTRR